MPPETALIRPTTADITQYDPEAAASALEHILATGDLAELKPAQRVAHYLALCRSLGLNSLSRPFDWLILDGKLVLYPNKSCAEQLRRQHQIRVRITRAEPVGTGTDDPMFVVKVEGTTPSGRSDEATKYVPLTRWDSRQGRKVRLAGQELANAYARAETGAKRRLVLSMVGLAGLPDELDGTARRVYVDGHGNVLETPSEAERYLAEQPSAAHAIGLPTFETTAAAEESPPVESQAARAEELERPKRQPAERASWRPTKQQLDEWQRTWFGTVKGLPLDDDEARHRYVEQWTASAGWPIGKRTHSLPTALARMTPAEAEDFLAQVRAVCEGDRQALLEDAAAAPEGETTPEPF